MEHLVRHIEGSAVTFLLSLLFFLPALFFCTLFRSALHLAIRARERVGEPAPFPLHHSIAALAPGKRRCEFQGDFEGI